MNRTGQNDADKILSRELEVINGLGLHARVAAKIAQTVQQFDCQVLLVKNDTKAEADSVLSILTLDAPKGTTLCLEAMGPQAGEALDALSKLFEKGFGE